MHSTGRFTPDLRRLVRDAYNQCCLCKNSLNKGVAAYAGYQSDGTPIYVGDCCKASLSELASYIYWWWETYQRPSCDAQLWRFMDFAKFVALLKDKGVYFSRADCLGDPFEGARGIAVRKTEWKEHCLEYFRSAIRNLPKEASILPTDKIEAEAERLFNDFERMGEAEVKHTFVSCWYNNDIESEALWRLYCPPNSAGVAIRTDLSSLKRSLDDDYRIKYGHVQYVDFRERFAGTYDRIFWKRKSLSHEAEVRAVIQKDWYSKSDDSGIVLPADLQCLIREVVVSPFAPSWFEDVLKETMAKYGLEARIRLSELAAQPFF